MQKCRVCEAPMQAESIRVCFQCREKLGITELPPATRRTLPCRCCNGMKFVRAVPREYSTSEYAGQQRVAPMAAAYEPNTEINRGLFGGPGYKVKVPNLIDDRAYGIFETYICVACGLVEWFSRAPEDIPIGPEYMTELIEYGGDEPYR